MKKRKRMTIFRPKYSKSEVSQRFNLKKLLGYSPSEAQKKLFYELAVDKMVDRTTDGKDIDGNDFEPYTEDYADKKGVGESSVNLISSGAMLSAFEQAQRQRNVVKIKMEEGKETLKSYNHNVGDTLPKRTHFGFNSREDIEDILRRVDNINPDQNIDLVEVRNAISQIGGDFTGF